MNPRLVSSFLVTVLACALAAPTGVDSRDRNQEKGLGQLVGRVSVEGRYEIPAPLKVNKNIDFCGSEVPNESFLVGTEGGLQNVIVSIPGLRRSAESSQLNQAVLDNKKCVFVPHVQVVSPGTEILLLNSDPILHNVHARLGAETLFNVGLPQWRTVTKRLDREGLIKVHCDVLHTWMTAYILVTSSPYFAVTNQRGEFVIEDVPAGTYKLEFWHEKLGMRSREVRIVDGGVLHVDVVYSVNNLQSRSPRR